MNPRDYDILKHLLAQPYQGQRMLAEATSHSLGAVNRSLQALKKAGYLDQDLQPTDKAREEARAKAPRQAIILAAGFGVRMVPVSTETPKGLVEVYGQRLIERLILQLHQVGIRDIHVVVGFQKERYEYLMDRFGVELVVNPAYATTNNLHSLLLASPYLDNAYVLPCDIWCRNNPFSDTELYSWYLVTSRQDEDSPIRVNRKQELVPTKEDEPGNDMIGIAYFLREEANLLRSRMKRMARQTRYDHAFWEDALLSKDRLIPLAKVIPPEDVVEINTYEQLRNLDHHSSHLQSEVMSLIASVLGTRPEKVHHIMVMKKGMTNRSFLFTAGGRRYIMRIPGEGTDQLISRAQETAVYQTIKGKVPSDKVLYIDPDNGYKITEYHEDSRLCDAFDQKDVEASMALLRQLHGLSLRVEHTFDIFGLIDFYQSLWQGAPSMYEDYQQTKDQVLSLQPYIDQHALPHVLTHIDPNCDNLLFVPDGHGGEDLLLLDWEYAGMQDPHVDLAMFCIYSMYNKTQVDKLIDTYFENSCTEAVRTKIYCYISACGLLWSNWCEYKRSLGVDFGEYSLRQYRFAKDYYRIVRHRVSKSSEL